MTGTYFYDANNTEFLAGTDTDPDLAADAATAQVTGAVEVGWPGYVRFLLTVVDPDASNDASLRVTMQGCETSDFSTSDVVIIGAFGLLDEASLVTDGATTTVGVQYELGPIYVDARFVRASVEVVDGTDGDFTGSTLYMVPATYDLGNGHMDSTSNPAQPSAGHKL